MEVELKFPLSSQGSKSYKGVVEAKPISESRGSKQDKVSTKLLFKDGSEKKVEWTYIDADKSDECSCEVVAVYGNGSFISHRQVSSFSVSRRPVYGVGKHINQDSMLSSDATQIAEKDGSRSTSTKRRGLLLKRKETGECEMYGEFERIANYSSASDFGSISTPPVSGKRTFTIHTRDDVFDNVVNVRNPLDKKICLDLESGGTEHISSIESVDAGSTYTVCIKHKRGRIVSGNQVSTEHRVIGIEVCRNRLQNNKTIRIVGLKEDGNGIASTNICELKDAKDILIKDPCGNIHREIPQIAYKKDEDIPRKPIKVSIDFSDTGVTKKNLLIILAAKISGVLKTSKNSTEKSDFDALIEAYPELENGIRCVDTVDDVRQLNIEGITLDECDYNWIENQCNPLQTF